MKTLKMFLIDVAEYRKSGVVEVEPKLENYYKLLNCDTIDIVTRKIGSKYYDIICDDEGLFTEEPIPAIFDTDRKPMIVGNILICNHDGEGNETELTDEEVKEIKSKLYSCNNGQKTWICIVGVDY